MSRRAALALALVTLCTGCGDPTGPRGKGPVPLPKAAYERALSQGADPALIHTVELPGHALAEQSAGALGDSDFGAVYTPTTPDSTGHVNLVVRAGAYNDARCESEPLTSPTDGVAAPVESCLPDQHGWYRAGGDHHEYVVRADHYHLVLGGPVEAVSREALVPAALGARRQDGTTMPTGSPTPTSSPVRRGDLPSIGDGAPINPTGPGG